jgi:ferredoxin--NADP+ reductase
VGKPDALAKLVHARQPDAVGAAGWRAIDAAEAERGARAGRPRDKFADVDEMLAAAAAAEAAPPPRRRLLAKLGNR